MGGLLRRAVALALLVSLPVVVSARADDAPGLRLVGTHVVDERITDLTFTTPSLDAPTTVRVMTPAGYDPSGATRYPVLWLLHGGGGSYLDWTTQGGAEAATAAYPFIVVMPDTTGYGNYVDWYNAGAYGPPKWETFHIGELLPWIDAHYPTVADRSGRAIAGLSMGGGGAMHDAARHPDLFTAAAAFSGAVDTNSLYVQPLTSTSGMGEGEMPNAVFGPRATDEVRWRGHNPWDLAMNLQGLFLQLDTGNGLPGGPGGGGDPVEAGVHEEMVSFHEQLDRLGYPHVWNDYGAGGHSWWYWNRDLRELLPRLRWTFAAPPAPPSRVAYTSIESSYSVYGWDVAIERPAVEFSTLVDAGASGFTLRGSGVGTVTTPAVYEPGGAYVVRVNGISSTVTADEHGRLTFTDLRLGTANPEQQYSPQARAWMLQRATFSTAHLLDDAQAWPVYEARVEISG